MLADLYAKALYRSLQQGQNATELLSSLQGVLRRRGHEHLAPAISRALGRERARVETREQVLLRTSPTLSAGERGEAEEATQRTFGEYASVTELKDDTLIGGFVAESHTHRIDQSYKRALLDLYERVRTTSH